MKPIETNSKPESKNKYGLPDLIKLPGSKYPFNLTNGKYSLENKAKIKLKLPLFEGLGASPFRLFNSETNIQFLLTQETDFAIQKSANLPDKPVEFCLKTHFSFNFNMRQKNLNKPVNHSLTYFGLNAIPRICRDAKTGDCHYKFGMTNRANENDPSVNICNTKSANIWSISLPDWHQSRGVQAGIQWFSPFKLSKVEKGLVVNKQSPNETVFIEKKNQSLFSLKRVDIANKTQQRSKKQKTSFVPDIGSETSKHDESLFNSFRFLQSKMDGFPIVGSSGNIKYTTQAVRATLSALQENLLKVSPGVERNRTEMESLLWKLCEQLQSSEQANRVETKALLQEMRLLNKQLVQSYGNREAGKSNQLRPLNFLGPL